MKLEVGMYVRFKKGKVTYIRKILEIIHNFETFNVYRTDKEYFDYEEKDYFDIVYPNEIIGKPSHNIIDLIEAGDIIAIKEDVDKFNQVFILGIYEPALLKEIKEKIKNCKLILESVLTKEQFESMSYKLGDE